MKKAITAAAAAAAAMAAGAPGALAADTPEAPAYVTENDEASIPYEGESVAALTPTEEESDCIDETESTTDPVSFSDMTEESEEASTTDPVFEESVYLEEEAESVEADEELLLTESDTDSEEVTASESEQVDPKDSSEDSTVEFAGNEVRVPANPNIWIRDPQTNTMVYIPISEAEKIIENNYTFHDMDEEVETDSSTTSDNTSSLKGASFRLSRARSLENTPAVLSDEETAVFSDEINSDDTQETIIDEVDTTDEEPSVETKTDVLPVSVSITPVTLEDSIAVTENAASNAFTDPSVSEILVEKDCVDAKDLTELIGGSPISAAKNTLTIRTKDEIIDYYAENLLPYFSGDLDTPYGILYFDGYDYDAYGGIGGPVYYYNGEQFETYDLFDDGTITLSEGYRELCIKLINFYRWMAGLDPVVENKELSEEAQVGADYLDMLEHTYGKDYVWSINPHIAAGSDMSEEGRVANQALSGSNIAFGMGVSFTNAIVLWMQDEGSIDNILANGHRASLMDPFATSFGIGINYSTNICYSLLCAGGHTDSPYYQQGYASALPVISITGLNSASDLASNEFAVPTLTLNFGDASGTGDSLLKKTDDTELILVRDDGAVYIIPNLLTDNPVTDEEEKSAVFTSSRWWINPYGNLSLSLAGLGADEVYGHDFTVYLTNFYTGKINGGVQTVKFSFTADTLGLDPVTLSADASLVKEAVASLGDVTFSDMDDIEALQQAYANLSKKDQILLASDKSTLDDLQAQAETGRADYEAAKAVTDAVASLDAQSLTLEDADLVEALRAAYDALTDAQKVYAGDDSAIETLEEKIASLKKEEAENTQTADTIRNAMNSANDLESMQNAYDQYLAANDAVKEKLADVYPAFKEAYDAAVKADLQAKEDSQAASEFEKLVSDALSGKDLTLDDEATLNSLEDYYATLSDGAKQLADRTLLDQAQNTLTQLKQEKAANEAAAKAVSDQIAALPSSVSLTDEDAISKARAAYDALTDTQKDMVDASSLTKLEQAEASLAAKKEAAANQEAAQAVSDAIAAADTDEALLAANDAYNNLTQAQKALVSEETLEQLNQKLADYEARENQKRTDKEAVANFEAKVNALPETVALTDKTAIEEVRRVYNALTDTQKAMTDDSALQKAEEALAKLEEAYQKDLETAKQAEDTIASFNRDDLTLSDKDAFEAALKAYDALTDTQKAMVSDDLADTIQAVNDRFEQLERAAKIQADAKDFQDKLNTLGGSKLTIDSKADYEALLEQYNSADSETRAAIDGLCAADWAWLQDTMNRIIAEDIKAANDAESFMEKLSSVTVNDGRDQSSVEALRQAYDALSDEAKAKLDESALTDLEDQLAAVLADEAEQVKDVQAMIDALGEPSLSMREELDTIKAKLDAMRPGLTQSVSQNKYLEALAAVEQLEAQEKAEQEAASDMQAKIDSLTVTDGSDADQVQAVRDAYDALDESVKNRVDAEKLIEAEQKLSEILAQEAKDVEAIQKGIANYQQSTLTYEDAQSILDLKEKADALRDGLKDQIDMDALNQLVDTANALIAEEKAIQDEVNAYQNQQNSTSVTNGLDQEAVEALRKAYDSLSDKAKERVSEDTLIALEASLQEVLKQENELVTSIQESIDAIPDTITLDDQEDIEALRARVAAIRPDLQNRLNLDKLENAEDKITGLTIEDQLKDIPETYDPAYDELISILGKQYDAMKDQTNLDPAAAVKLESLLEQKAEYDRKKAEEADSLIGLITNDDNQNTKDAAKAAYDNLTDDQKAYLSDKAKALVSPQTGTQANPFVPIAAGAIAAAGLGIALKKKKKLV